MFSFAWKEISRRPSRSALSIAGYVLVALLVAGGICLGAAMRRATTEPLRVTGADLVVHRAVVPCAFAEVKRPKDLGAISMEDVARLRATPGVRSVSGSLVVWAFHGGQPTVVAGVAPGNLKTGPLRQYRDGDRCCILVAGRLFGPEEEDATILDQEYATQLGVTVEDKVQLGPRQFRVVGILQVVNVAVIGGGQAYVPLSTVQQMLNEGPVVDYVFVSTEADADLARVEEAIRGVIGKGCEISSSRSLPGQISRSAAVTASGSGVFVVLIAVVGALLMIRSALASVRERVTEIGILRAIGWRKRHVVSLLGMEMALQGMIGAVPGIAVGYAMAFVVCLRLNLRLPATFNAYPPCATTEPALRLTLLPRVEATGVAVTFLLTVAAALLAGLVAGHYAARRAPAESLRQP
jgi:putative ABC transport system permease protein